jgi:starvation-inducible DNA-binding protein
MRLAVRFPELRGPHVEISALEAVKKMYVSNRKVAHDSPVSSVGDLRAHKTTVLLDELLTHTLPLRDLYKSARCQAADIHLRHLRPLFATHYEEQLALVDVLVDRIRALGGASRVLAGAFLQGTPPSYTPRGRLAPNRLLCDLLDAHETVMSAVHMAGTYSQQLDSSAVQDFAVGQVLLTNDHQGCAVRGQLVKLDQARSFAISSFSGVDTYE